MRTGYMSRIDLLIRYWRQLLIGFGLLLTGSALAAAGYKVSTAGSASSTQNSIQSTVQAQSTQHHDTAPQTPQAATMSDSSQSDSHSISTHVQALIQSSGSQKPNVDLKVNGKPVKVPVSGESHQTIIDANGSTSLNISSRQSANNNTNGSSSTSIQIQADSSSENDVQSP